MVWRVSEQLAAKPPVALRRQRLEALIDLGSGVGLEIGPLDSPLVTAPPWDVRYLDVLNTEALRDYWRHDPNVEVEFIVQVDFPLKLEGKTRTLAEAASPSAPYRWAVASHVIEHVPDLIGWLGDVAEVLDDGGRLFLVVPDRRFTFDAIRPATTVGQLLEAHSRRDTAPSERAVYDHFRSQVQISAAELWAGASAADAPRAHTLQLAASMREAALRGQYVDSHVWVFSSAEFVAQLADLGELDMCDFAIETILPTAPGELEFNVVLQRLPRDADAERRMALRRAGLAVLDEGPTLGPRGNVADNTTTVRAIEVSELEERFIHAKREAMRRLLAFRTSIGRQSR
jgi:SAM-dependent methyltransferase